MKKIQLDTYTAAVRKAYEILKQNGIEVTARSLELAVQEQLKQQRSAS